MIIIPAIDIFDGKSVRLTQGDFGQKKVYSDDPVKIALSFEEQGAPMLHVIDLNGAKDGIMENLNLIKRIKESVEVPIEVGGGIRDAKTAEFLVEIGVDQIILGTVAVEDQELFKYLLQRFKSKITVSLDAKNGQLVTDGWLNNSGANAIEVAKTLSGLGVLRFIYTDVLKDGTLTSPNFEAIKDLQQKIGQSIIASGGISSLDDLNKLKKLGVAGAVLGKSLYEDRFSLKEAINAS